MAFSLSRGKFTLEAQKKAFTASYIAVSDDWHTVVTETAGFVPLEVRFQKLQENGVRVMLRAQEFDSVDMRKLYLDDQFRVEPDDELEEIETKLRLRAEYLSDLKTKKSEKMKQEEKIQASESKTQKPASESAPSSEAQD